MENNSWTVVMFLDDNTVEAVPSKWLHNEDQCYWPSFNKNKRSIAIKHCQPVGDKSLWKLYPVKCFRNGTHDNYKTARDKSKRAEVMSDLALSDKNGKRSTKRNRKFSTSSDESSELEPPRKHTKNTSRELVPITPIPAVHIDDPQKHDSSINSSTTIDTTPAVLQDSSTMSMKDAVEELINDENKVPVPVIDNDNHPVIAVKKKNKSHKGSKDESRLKTRECLKMVLKKQKRILTEISELKTSNLLILKKLSENGTVSDASNEDLNNFWSGFSLPLKTEEELDKFEDFLRVETNMEKSVRLLIRLGGDREEEFVRRSMKKLISDDIQKMYSWAGLKNKKNFSALRVYKLIMTSGMKSLNEPREKKMENAFKNYLRRAAERIAKSSSKIQ